MQQIRLSPIYADWTDNLGMSWIRRIRQHFESTQASETTPATTEESRKHRHTEQDRLVQQLARLNATIEQSQGDVPALVSRAEVHARLGDTDSSLADLGRALQLSPNDARLYFSYATSHLRAGNKREAFSAFLRVAQLSPGNTEAREMCNRLASEIWLFELYEGAKVMEDFALSHCGPGYGWAVDIVEAWEFNPGRPPATYFAALLNLRQTPSAVLQLTVVGEQYRVILMAESPLEGISRTMFRQVTEETSPRQTTTLLQTLNELLRRGLLVKDNNSLRYYPHGDQSVEKIVFWTFIMMDLMPRPPTQAGRGAAPG